MTSPLTRKACLHVLVTLVWLVAPRQARGQSTASCGQAFSNLHQTLDCVEGVFTEAPVHATLSSIPPGNGFPLGIVYEDAVHHLSSPFGTPPPDATALVAPVAYKSLTDVTLGVVGSTNDSWYAAGSVVWLPPLHYTDATRHGVACHQLGPFCTQQVMGLELYASHRSLKTLAFYGLGDSAAATPYAFREADTYGGAIARLPLWNWLRVEGQVENRKPSLGASAMADTFTEATAPGISSQPDFMHYSTTLRTDVTAIAESVSNPLTAAGGGGAQALMKPRLVYRFQNNAGYHWYNDMDTGHYSFQQFVFDGDESVQFGSVLQRFVAPGTSALVKAFCGGNKATDTCDFGTLDMRSTVILSSVAGSNAVPFYFQPTIGGSDIESRLTLRGFSDYRFRDANAAIVQTQFGRTIVDPLGAFIFYDAGTVGPTAQELSPSHFRQDGGLGLSVRLRGQVMLQTFAALGAGGGIHLGYSFTKFF